jgi:hypothetical protein
MTGSSGSGFTAASPAAFGFDDDPASIRFDGVTLRTELDGNDFLPGPAESLTVIGGDISFFNSWVFFHNADLDLVAVGGAGDVGIESDRLVPDEQLLGNVFVTSTDAGPFADLETSGGPAGKISITADNLVMRGSRIFVDSIGIQNGPGIDIDAGTSVVLSEGARISTDTRSRGDSGNIEISTSILSLEDKGTRVSSDSHSHSHEGNGGLVNVTADAIVVAEGAVVSATTNRAGAAGRISLSAMNVSLVSGGSVATTTTAAGRGGDITVSAERMVIAGAGSSIATKSGGEEIGGDAGNIVVIVDDLVLSAGGVIETLAGAALSGQVGDIDMDAMNIRIERGGKIEVSSQSAREEGGRLTVTAESLLLDGQVGDEEPPLEMPSRIVVTMDGDALGGGATLRVDEIFLIDAAEIVSVAVGSGRGAIVDIIAARVGFDGARIGTQASTGQGGNLVLNADELLVVGGGLIESRAGVDGGSGDGGDIRVMTDDAAVSGDGSSVRTIAGGDGCGGDLLIDGGSVALSEGAVTHERQQGRWRRRHHGQWSDRGPERGHLVSCRERG